jgi:hypothetical protein
VRHSERDTVRDTVRETRDERIRELEVQVAVRLLRLVAHYHLAGVMLKCFAG